MGDLLARARRDVQIRAILRVWLFFHVPLAVGLLAAACSRGGTSPTTIPSSEPGASLVVSLEPSAETPTAIRMEVSNPNAGAIAFCIYQTPFEGVLDARGSLSPCPRRTARREIGIPAHSRLCTAPPFVSTVWPCD